MYVLQNLVWFVILFYIRQTFSLRKNCVLWGKGRVQQFDSYRYQILGAYTYVMLSECSHRRYLLYAEYDWCQDGICTTSLTLYTGKQGIQLTRGLAVNLGSKGFFYPTINNTVTAKRFNITLIDTILKIDYLDHDITIFWDGLKNAMIQTSLTDSCGLCSIQTAGNDIYDPTDTNNRDSLSHLINEYMICTSRTSYSKSRTMTSSVTGVCQAELVDKPCANEQYTNQLQDEKCMSLISWASPCSTSRMMLILCTIAVCDGDNPCDITNFAAGVCQSEGTQVDPMWRAIGGCDSRKQWLDYIFFVGTGASHKLTSNSKRSNSKCKCLSRGTLFCTPEGQCNCNMFSAGPSCSQCKSNYYGIVGFCKPCRCDPLGKIPGTTCNRITGKCTCRRDMPIVNRDKCTTCHRGTYLYKDRCLPCRCGRMAAETTCDVWTGHCSCLKGVKGRTCHKCAKGYYGFVSNVGCTMCQCNIHGTLSGSQSCHRITGQCRCLPGRRFYNRKTCDGCPVQNKYPFHSYIHHTTRSCKPCRCSIAGSRSLKCDLYTGRCLCKEETTGAQCSKAKCTRSEWSGWNGCNCGWRTRTRIISDPIFLSKIYQSEVCDVTPEIDYEQCENTCNRSQS